MKIERRLFFYKTYFKDFFDQQSPKVRKKIIWTLKIVEELERIPEVYFKHMEGTDGIYEIRIQSGGNIFRVFSFFDNNNLIIIGNGFQKKTQKTPLREIERANKIKKEYYESKKESHQP
jgi:phage-related protein